MKGVVMIRKTIALDESLITDLELYAKKDERDFSSASRYALRIGLLALENTELTVQEIKDIMAARVDLEAGNLTPLDMRKF
jgi:hypothetical protein